MKLSFLLFAQVASTANAAGAAYTLNNKKEDSSEQNSLRGGVASSKHQVRSLQGPADFFVNDLAGPSGDSPDFFGPGPADFGPGPADFGPSPDDFGPSPDDFGPSPDDFGPGGPFPGPPGGPDLGPGESNCIPHPSLDGTLFCGFRSRYGVADITTNSNTNTHLSCVTDNNLGYQYCANIGMYLQPDPNGSMAPPPGLVGPGPLGPGWWSDSGPSASSDEYGPAGYYSGSGPSDEYGPGLGYYSGYSGSSDEGFGPGRPEHNFGLQPNQGGGRKCPKFTPTTGSHCCGWIPVNLTEESCYYDNGTTQCNCARQDNECGTRGWQCRGI